MVTPKQVHLKIQEISNSYATPSPLLHIDTLVAAFNIDKSQLFPQLAALEQSGFISYYVGDNNVIKLTELGKDEAPD
jgi:hypothetical protein